MFRESKWNLSDVIQSWIQCHYSPISPNSTLFWLQYNQINIVWYNECLQGRYRYMRITTRAFNNGFFESYSSVNMELMPYVLMVLASNINVQKFKIKKKYMWLLYVLLDIWKSSHYVLLPHSFNVEKTNYELWICSQNTFIGGFYVL